MEQDPLRKSRWGFFSLSRIIKDDFFWQATVVLVASMVGCGFSYLYQIYVGRELGPEGVEP